MVGSLNSMIGMQKESIIHNFRTQMPVKFIVDDSAPFVMSGVCMDINIATGKAVKVEKIRIVDENA